MNTHVNLSAAAELQRTEQGEQNKALTQEQKQRTGQGAQNKALTQTVGFDPEEDITFDPEMYLTEHFQLKEFTRSATAIDNGVTNNPGPEEVARLQALCENLLEPLRRKMGVIRITSGYRSYVVNKLVDGSRTSQHLYGEAADIYCGSVELGRKYYNFIMENLDFDQLLLEFKGKKKMRIHCLHVSFRSDRGPNRRQCRSYYPV